MNISNTLLNEIKAAGQEHVLSYWNELDEAGKSKLAGQLENINFAELARLVPEYVLNRPKTEIPDDLAPAPYFPETPENEEQKALYAKAYDLGIELLKSGRVCFLTVAGGLVARLVVPAFDISRTQDIAGIVVDTQHARLAQRHHPTQSGERQ